MTGISAEAMKLLNTYAWPGNVRELEHTIERIVILEDGDLIQPEHLPSFISQRQGEFQVFTEEDHTLEELETTLHPVHPAAHQGPAPGRARILGINRKTLSYKIEKYNLRVNW